MLLVEGLSKTFPGTRALDDVRLEVADGEIHSLVGANGSGKSTLIKAVAGVQPADPGGVVETGGRRLEASAMTAEIARDAGILAVHQEPAVFGELTVAENLAVGTGIGVSRLGRLRWRAIRKHAEAVIEQFGLETRPDDLAGDLRPALRSMLAIARTLAADRSGAGVLILDEPTALLPLHDVELLHEHLRRQAAEGRTILYVSHRLDEVVSLSDRITVLRDGCRTGTFDGPGCSQRELADAMFGPAAGQVARKPVGATGPPVLTLKGVRAGRLRDVDLAVHAGEVVGVVGLAGAGAADVLRVAFGAEPHEQGTMRVAGEPVRMGSPARARAAGVGFILGDLSSSVFPGLSLAENLAIADLPAYGARGRVSTQRVRAGGAAAIDAYGVRAGGPDAPIATLSGGNQQKVVFARWLRRRPAVLLLEDPTAGVDVASRTEIYRLLGDALQEGLGVLIASSDFEELAFVCDRVLVLRDGRVAAEARGAEVTSAALSALVYDEGAADGRS